MTLPLQIADKTFNSRLLTGTGKFASAQVMQQALTASATQIVTLALKRCASMNRPPNSGTAACRWACNCCPTPPVPAMPKKRFSRAQLAREALRHELAETGITLIRVT